MRAVIKLECKKAFRSKGFYISIMMGVLVVVLHTVWVILNTYATNNEMYREVSSSSYMDSQYGYWYEMGILQGWLGCETFSPYNSMFFMIFPLLAAISYGISFYDEWKSNYVIQMVTRCGRKSYLKAKYIATFISGGLSVVIPLTVSLIVAACYLPVIGSDPMALQTTVANGFLWYKLFYHYPLLYALAYMLLDFICGGMFACIVPAVSKWFNNRFAAVIFPLLINITLYYGIYYIWPDTTKYNIAIFINPAQNMGQGTAMSISVATLILIIMTFGLFILGNKKRDVLN